MLSVLLGFSGVLPSLLPEIAADALPQGRRVPFLQRDTLCARSVLRFADSFFRLPAASVPQEHIRSFKETIIGFLTDQEVILKLTAEQKELSHRCVALKRRGKGSGADTKGRLCDPVGGKTVTRSLRISKTLIAEKQSGGTGFTVPPLTFLRVC